MTDTLKELTGISGKGGTGKTSVVASFAALAENSVLADCDVDAPDLHIILEPHILHHEEFIGGKKATIEPEGCTQCGQCLEVCRFNAVKRTNGESGNLPVYEIDPVNCEGCGVCAYLCPEETTAYKEEVNGDLLVSETRFGPMVHARLRVAEENSGKLVTLVRNRAKELAEKGNRDVIIVDGAPGIGCPVIASITGATMVLVVTEPTLSGFHDLDRVIKLCHFFNIPAMVCINKYDLNPGITTRIEKWCADNQSLVAGTIPYDPDVTAAQVARKSTVEFSDGPAALAIKSLWQKVSGELYLVGNERGQKLKT